MILPSTLVFVIKSSVVDIVEINVGIIRLVWFYIYQILAFKFLFLITVIAVGLGIAVMLVAFNDRA